MLNKITAAAISTALCLNTAIPCVSNCSELQMSEKNTNLNPLSVVINNFADTEATDENATPDTSISTTEAEDSLDASISESDIEEEPVEQEPIEEGVLGATISYRLYEDGTLYISGRGIMNNYSKSPFKSPELINKVIVSNNEGTIFTVGSFVFSNCSNMTEIYLPNTIITIEKNAFEDCTSLSIVQFDGADEAPKGELILSDSIEDVKDAAFLNCTSIESVFVPKTVMSVGKSVFSGCTSLKKAVINSEKAVIGEYIFNRCISLEELTLPFAGYNLDTVNKDESTAWLGYMFGDAVSDDSGEYTYGARSYSGTTRYIPKSLESITILGGQSIPKYAFDNFIGLKKIVIPDSIKIIGDASFRNCTLLTEFNMPSSLTAIGKEAFANCKNISVDIPEGVTSIGNQAFEDCTSITEITIPEATEIIGDSAFSGCTSLKKAVINGKNAKIGTYIFSRCISLEELTLPFAGYDLNTVNEDDSTAWFGFMFGDAVSDDSGEYTYGVRYSGYVRNIPKSLESITISGGQNISSHAFDGFSSLKKIVIPDDIKIIGVASFRNCTLLTEFNMPSSLTAIGKEAFANCKNISVDIPEGVTSIGNQAFEGCASIEEITVPEATEIIGDSAFSGCTSLKKAVIKGGNQQIGNYIFNRCISLEDLTLPFAAFSEEVANTEEKSAWFGFMFGDAVSDDSGEYTYGVSYSGYLRNIPKSLESITISGGQNISSHAFDGFSSLKKIVLPDDVKIIGVAAFRNCSSLTDFTMPLSVTSIGNEAFENCASLPSIDIPKGVTKIGNKAFADCSSITEITVHKATEIIGDSAFSGCTSLKKAVIKGGNQQIGNYIFNRCISLEDLTLPFAAFSEEAANTEEKSAWLGFMFGDAVSDDNGDYTYSASYSGYLRHIPNSLENITFIGGEYVAGHLLQGFGGVKNVTLPETIKGIGESAFLDCDNIENVFYQETEESWGDVDVKNKNESIEDKIIFFADPVLGDTNGDGLIDASDASNILAKYAGNSTGSDSTTKYEYKIYDVNRDNVIDASDASVVLTYYAYASTSNDNLSFEEFLKQQSK